MTVLQFSPHFGLLSVPATATDQQAAQNRGNLHDLMKFGGFELRKVGKA